MFFMWTAQPRALDRPVNHGIIEFVVYFRSSRVMGSLQRRTFSGWKRQSAPDATFKDGSGEHFQLLQKM